MIKKPSIKFRKSNRVLKLKFYKLNHFKYGFAWSYAKQKNNKNKWSIARLSEHYYQIFGENWTKTATISKQKALENMEYIESFHNKSWYRLFPLKIKKVK